MSATPKILTVPAGVGFWYVDRYPRGGDFGRFPFPINVSVMEERMHAKEGEVMARILKDGNLEPLAGCRTVCVRESLCEPVEVCRCACGRLFRPQESPSEIRCPQCVADDHDDRHDL